MNARVVTVAILAGGLAVGACSSTDQDKADGPAPTVPGARGIEVGATSFAYDPPRLEIEAGQPVNVILSSAGIFHDLTVEEVDFRLSASAGETVGGSLVIDEPGTYTGFCSVPGHRSAGMEIPIVVS